MIVLTVHIASPSACLLFKRRCLLDMHLQTVSTAFMLHGHCSNFSNPTAELVWCDNNDLSMTCLFRFLWEVKKLQSKLPV